jgi:hypothetical protein
MLPAIVEPTALSSTAKPRAPRPFLSTLPNSALDLILPFPATLDALFLLPTETKDVLLDRTLLTRPLMAWLQTPMFRTSAILHPVTQLVARGRLSVRAMDGGALYGKRMPMARARDDEGNIARRTRARVTGKRTRVVAVVSFTGTTLST